MQLSFPRVSGVLVPASLRQAGCLVGGTTDGSAAPGDRAKTAGEVVAWVRRTQRRLPAALLDSALPPPDVILKSWVIGSRTRGSLERILSAPNASKMQRVRDYVDAERLGVHGLVDLLAAREEVAVVSPNRLDALSATIRGLLPVVPLALPAALASSGLADAPLTFDDVVRIYREENTAAPFRVVRRAGATVLVPIESLGAAETLLANAAHYVFNWGVCTVRALLDRLRALTGVSIEQRAATRILTAIPRFRWVDEAAGCFSFAEYSTRLAVAVRKVFTMSERVRLVDLIRALGNAVELLATVPRRALATYLSKVVGCTIVDGWVRPPETLASVPLERGERALVQALRDSGGVAPLSALREQAGLTARTLRRVTRTSPLLLVKAGTLRLVGVARPRLVPERRRRAVESVVRAALSPRGCPARADLLLTA